MQYKIAVAFEDKCQGTTLAFCSRERSEQGQRSRAVRSYETPVYSAEGRRAAKRSAIEKETPQCLQYCLPTACFPVLSSA